MYNEMYNTFLDDWNKDKKKYKVGNYVICLFSSTYFKSGDIAEVTEILSNKSRGICFDRNNEYRIYNRMKSNTWDIDVKENDIRKITFGELKRALKDRVVWNICPAKHRREVKKMKAEKEATK